MFGLCSTFCYKFAWCDVCFGRCGGRAVTGTLTPPPAPLLEDRPGQGPPNPPRSIGEEMLGLWKALGGGTPSWRVWDVQGCVLRSGAAVSALVAEQELSAELALAGTHSTGTNGSFPL